MNVRVITLLMCVGLAATATAEPPPSGKAASPGATAKPKLSEVRSAVHDLEAATGKLSDLMNQYRSLVEQRPQAQGGSPEAKKAHDKQLGKWSRAVERLMRRLRKAHAAVVDGTQRLDQAASGKLPTTVAKEVANARNEAESVRVAAEQVLAKHKPSKTGAKGRAKKAPAPEETEPPPLGDIDDL